MGGPVQKIFQGRGDKKGKGSRLVRALPPALLCAVWICLLADLPSRKPQVWFPLSGAAVAVCLGLHLFRGRKSFSYEFLFSVALFLGGIVHSTGLTWLRFAFFPLLISASAFYDLGTVVPLALFIPAADPRLYAKSGIPEWAAFAFALTLTGLIGSAAFGRLRREKERMQTSLNSIMEKARHIGSDTVMESLHDEEVMAHYFASMLQADAEIGDLLQTVRQTVFADSATLFVPNAEGFTVRCTTAERGEIIVTGKGVVERCLREKKMMASGEIKEQKIDPGYIKGGSIGSIAAVPLMEGPTVIGALTVDSSRFQAFAEAEKNAVRMFASHLVRVLERERIYMMIKRDIFGLRVLGEESSGLVSSLNVDVIAARLCSGIEKIAPSRVFLFLQEKNGFMLVHGRDRQTEAGTKRRYDFRGTFMDMVVQNKQPIYVSDVREYRIPVMPFQVDDVRSLMAIPMVYEDSLLGLFVLISDRLDALDVFQRDMLKVMCNQALTSIANARLHAEIEKLATTDGLTGLFNHRRFQERLSEEFRRLKRSTAPVALMLTDIDHFKKINDTYGHPIGDVVLKDVARLIREAIRDVDMPARYGGEEFAVILPGADAAGAKAIAERLRKAVMAKSFSADGKPFSVTLSVGVASAPDDAKTKEELISKTDQALYHAKHSGRNRSVVWSSIRQ